MKSIALGWKFIWSKKEWGVTSGVSSHFGYWVQAIVACIILILILYLISIIIIIIIVITSVNFEPLRDHNDCCAAAAASSSV